jgi:hypothetical protein
VERGAVNLSSLWGHPPPINITWILREQDQDCDDGKEETEEKPKPTASSAMLCPQRTKRAEQEENQTLAPNSSDLLFERRNANLELIDTLGLGLGEGRAAEKHGNHKEEVDALHNISAQRFSGIGFGTWILPLVLLLSSKE